MVSSFHIIYLNQPICSMQVGPTQSLPHLIPQSLCRQADVVFCVPLQQQEVAERAVVDRGGEADIPVRMESFGARLELIHDRQLVTHNVAIFSRSDGYINITRSIDESSLLPINDLIAMDSERRHEVRYQINSRLAPNVEVGGVGGRVHPPVEPPSGQESAVACRGRE